VRRKNGYTYIITNAHHNVLYVGVTSDLLARIEKHRNKFYPKSFSAQYNVFKLVYYEVFPDSIVAAIAREKQLKAGSRKKKESLINSLNPGWVDLYEDLVEGTRLLY
jgi:putative endonuclease